MEPPGLWPCPSGMNKPCGGWGRLAAATGPGCVPLWRASTTPKGGWPQLPTLGLGTMQGPGTKDTSLQPAWLCGAGGGCTVQQCQGPPKPIGTHRGAGTRGEALILLGVQMGSASRLAGSSSQPHPPDWVTAEASVWVDDGLFCKQNRPGANNAAEQIDGQYCLFWEEKNYFP